MKDFVYFRLDGCDISFIARAPKDMTMEQFVKQSNRIKPDWCACGVVKPYGDWDIEHVEIEFDYDDVKKLNTDVACEIKELEDNNE